MCYYEIFTRDHGIKCFDHYPKPLPTDTIKICVHTGEECGDYCSSDPKTWPHHDVAPRVDFAEAAWTKACHADPQPFGWYAVHAADVRPMDTQAVRAVKDSHTVPISNPLSGNDSFGPTEIKRDGPDADTKPQTENDSSDSATAAKDATITPTPTLAVRATTYDYNTVPESNRGPRWSEYSMGISMGRISSTVPPPVEGPVWRSYSAYTASLASASAAAMITPRVDSSTMDIRDSKSESSLDAMEAAAGKAVSAMTTSEPSIPRRTLPCSPNQIYTPYGPGQICSDIDPILPPTLMNPPEQKHPASTIMAQREAVPPGVTPPWPPATPGLVTKRKVDGEMPLVPVPFIV